MTAPSVISQLLSGNVAAPARANPPSKPGYYAWWCRRTALVDATPSIPYEGRAPISTEWSLLYVGISPVSPSSAASGRTIATRIDKDHRNGNIGGSTFRQSVASLLIQKLSLKPRIGSDRSRLEDEAPLSKWLEASCGLTFAVSERPWEWEAEVIGLLNPPLNIDDAAHPFRLKVKEQRSALRRACGL